MVDDLDPIVLAYARRVQAALDDLSRDPPVRDARNIARSQAHWAAENLDADACARLSATILSR
jgi:hypothetical protein